MNVRPRLLHEALEASAQRVPAKVALIADGQEFTYAQLHEAVQRLAASLQARGIRRGDRIAIYMDNSWWCAVSIYAALTAGGVFVLINPQTKADKLRFILKDSGAAALLADASLLGEVPEGLLGDCHPLRLIALAGARGLPHHSPAHTETSALEDLLSSPAEPVPAGVIPLDLAALIYTSGSTGSPKGVMQTHQSMVFASGSLIEYLRLGENARILCVLPLAFDYGLYQLLMSVCLGATLVLERNFAYPAQVLSQVSDQAITVFPGVPTIFALLIAAHQRNPLQFPSVDRVTNTAAALPSEYVPALRQIFPRALIYRMYGLTECKRVSYLEPELVDSKPDSVGKAIPGTEVFLRTPEGEAVAAGEPGILHVRGPHVMAGYWNQPELSARMLRPGPLPGERILCTHDWFRQDEEGYLYFVGRSDDIIKSRGEKVSPVEVENVLHGIRGVREAAVVGVPDPLLGQAVRAYVALEHDSGLNERELRRLCAEQLENFMVPREILILPELPKTDTGKISKKSLGKEDMTMAAGGLLAERAAANTKTRTKTREVAMAGSVANALSPEVLHVDAALEAERIAGQMRAILRESLHRRGLVVAVSGGVDSAVCAALAVKAVGPQRVFALLLPEQDSSSDSVRLGRAVCESLGVEYQLTDIAPALEALGCYRWRDEAIRQVFPDYGPGWKNKLVISGGAQGRFNHFKLVVQPPQGELAEERLELKAYLQIVAATNFKQRVRKTMEYFHADRLNYAVVGTPNRLEYDQGFFVKNGDGSADLKPIAHLYKSQVYALARHLGLPEAVCNARPTTDTYSLAQGQDEFYFALPYQQMDLALWAYEHGRPAHELAQALQLSLEAAEHVYRDIEAKRRATRYLHLAPVLVAEPGELPVARTA